MCTAGTKQYMKNGVDHTARFAHVLFSEMNVEIKQVITGYKSNENKIIKAHIFSISAWIMVFHAFLRLRFLN
jgi:hypothetical protein